MQIWWRTKYLRMCGKCDADPRDKETLQLGQASTLVTFDKEPGHSEMLIWLDFASAGGEENICKNQKVVKPKKY